MPTALILAAGSGSRMWPYADVRNKAALPVSGRPLITHTAHALRACGVEDVAVLAGRFANQLKAALLGFEGVRVVETPETAGTADTLLSARALAGEDFIVLYGDVLYSENDLERFIRESAGMKTAALVAPLGPESAGAHICCGVRDGSVTEILGHPRGGCEYRFAGFKFTPEIFSYLERCPDFFPSVQVGMMPPRERFIEAALAEYLKDCRVGAVVCGDSAVDMDKPWHVLAANAVSNARICGALKENSLGENAQIDKTAVINGFVRLGKNSRIGPNVIIEGNCVIGDDTVVTNGAILRGGNVIGNRCFIGNCCFISENSTVGDGCVVNHCAELDGVIFENVYLYHYMEIYGVIGSNTDIGAATVCGSLRFDDGECSIDVKGRKERPTGYSCATFIGDFCRTGVNVTIMPGKRIGPYSVIGAATLLNEDVPNNTLIYPKQELVRKSWGSERYGW